MIIIDMLITFLILIAT